MGTPLNAPCPCGSGKKYKRCCGLPKNTKKDKKQKDFFEKFDSADTLRTTAALSIWPANHGKNIRLDEIAMVALSKYHVSKESGSSKQWQMFLQEQYPSHHLEDPPVNLFTELITFYGGDYLIFPGITESTVFILSSLLSAIFNWPDNRLDEKFKSNCKQCSRIMLLLSNLTAERAGYQRYLPGKKTGNPITIPPESELRNLKQAVFFSHDELSALLEERGIPPEALNEFVADKNVPLTETRYGADPENPLLSRPLVQTPEGYILAIPSTISFAITEYIRNHAKVWKCEDQLHQTFHDYVWHSSQVSLQNMGFKSIDIPELVLPAGMAPTSITQFDNDKLAIIQYLPLSQPGKMAAADTCADQRAGIIDQLRTLARFKEFEFLEITIGSMMGNDAALATVGKSNSLTLALFAYDLDLLYHSKECRALDLWKFTQARMTQLPRFAAFTPLSLLDQYQIYKDHHDSFYLSDESGFDPSLWVYGHSQEFVQEVKLLEDNHSMLCHYDGRLVSKPVSRKEKYSPVYVSQSDIMHGILQFAIEGYSFLVWVKPLMDEEISDELNHTYWELTDALSYWVWQICGDLKDRLQTMGLPCVDIYYDLDDPQKFETIDDRFVREPAVYDKLNVESDGSSITLRLPFEIMPYFYGADNEGDRILVLQLLQGINALLVKNNQAPLTDEEIQMILEKNAPTGNKKKLIIIHTRSNLLLDPRHLPKFRYIQEYDAGVVSDSIGKWLGPLLPKVGEVSDPEEKKLLGRNIVMKALLPQLKAIIKPYDNESLLQRLIGLNESLIHHREDLKLKTPTRIACFVAQDEHIEDLHEEMADLSRTILAVRCLLEHIGAEPCTGNKIVSTTAIDELIAIMDAIISWGSVGDQLQFELFDIKIGILPTGRIGTQKHVSREIFDPYLKAKTKETVSDAIKAFQQEFPLEANDEKNPLPQNIDHALLTEFHVSFTRICLMIEALAGIAFSQSAAYASLDKKSLFDQVNKSVDAFDQNEFDAALDFLSITNRGTVENIPKGFESFDISPWRFNRRLSLLRKPLIAVTTSDPANPMLYWGARQVLVCRMTIAEQLYTDRFKIKDTSPLKKVMGKLATQRGAQIVTTALSHLQLPDHLIDSEVTISPHGKLKHTIDIGDIDVLFIDLVNKIIYSLECKGFAASRNIKEMVEECEKLLGSKSKKGLIAKHIERHDWLKYNLPKLSALYGKNLNDFTIKSAFVTGENMLFPHLQEVGVSMAFLTIYDLEEKGIAALSAL